MKEIRPSLSYKLESTIAIATYKWNFLIIFSILQLNSIMGQPPNWTAPSGLLNSMVAIITISDECIPSADERDMVAAFDLSGQIRGVDTTNIDNKAFLTIHSDGEGEDIFFKVYDASTDQVYNIYDVIVTFVSDGSIGIPPDPPIILNFDSQPQGVDAGADQEIWNTNITNLSATGDGHWTIIQGVGGFINNPSVPNTSFTGLPGSQYVLAWTLNDTAGCIGETDEIEVVFVINEPEGNLTTCGDGLDNDGDGFTDCADSTCGQPIITEVIITDPTPIDCSTTASDGQFEIVQTGADLFSLDMGNTSQVSSIFSNLEAGTYNVWMQNTVTGCIKLISVVLENNFNPLNVVGEIVLEGPEFVCVGTNEVEFALQASPVLGNLEWDYTGTDIQIIENGFAATLDFGGTATSGLLIATLTEECGTLADTLAIGISDPLLCAAASCPKIVQITNAIINVPQSPHVYRASEDMTLNAQIMTNDYQFSAGKEVEFSNEFEINLGSNMIIDIKNCQLPNND